MCLTLLMGQDRWMVSGTVEMAVNAVVEMSERGVRHSLSAASCDAGHCTPYRSLLTCTTEYCDGPGSRSTIVVALQRPVAAETPFP